jgi:hypothetical protein
MFPQTKGTCKDTDTPQFGCKYFQNAINAMTDLTGLMIVVNESDVAANNACISSSHH